MTIQKMHIVSDLNKNKNEMQNNNKGLNRENGSWRSFAEILREKMRNIEFLNIYHE